MNERRPRSGRVVGLAEGVAAAVRRRQREREPRVVVYGPSGVARVVAPSAPRYDELLDAAERLVQESAGGSGLRAGGARSGAPADDPDETTT